MKRFLSLLLVLCTLFCLFPVAVSADEVEEVAQSVLSFDYLSLRTSGDNGIRAVFAVDQDAVAALTGAGYTVVYGAIMAVNSVKKPYISGKQSASTTVYNESAADVTVKLDGASGKAALATGTNAAIISSDNGMKYLDAAKTSFAFTTVYDVTYTKLYEDGLRDTKMLYRGFTIVTDPSGNSTVYYDDLALSDATLNTPSLYSVCDHMLRTNDSLPREVKQRLQTITYLPWSPPII